MTDAPKLLTEAEWRRFFTDCGLIERTTNGLLPRLHVLGLIAPEPVDPLLIEAREIVARILEDDGLTNLARHTRDGSEDDSYRVRIALTALRRNLELAERPTLTQRQAALLLCNAMNDAKVEDVSRYDLGPAGQTTRGNKIAAALVERLK